MVYLAPFRARTFEEALGAGPRLVAACKKVGAPTFSASLLEGPGLLLGCHQRAARVVDLDRCRAARLPVFRRVTAGTAAFVEGRALLFSLALPHVAALFPDASNRTLLNRNVRPFLRGLSAAGALSHYFGREWVSCRKRPLMLLAFDVAEDGAVLIEAIAGFDAPFAVPARLAAADELALARFTGHQPMALAEVLPAGTGPEGVVRCVAEALVARAAHGGDGATDVAGTHVSDRASDVARAAHGGDRAADVARTHGASMVLEDFDVPDLANANARVDLDGSDPLPMGATLREPARIPIGWLERASVKGEERGGAAALWLGGDVLAPRWLLDRIAASAPDVADVPLEGISLQELLRLAV